MDRQTNNRETVGPTDSHMNGQTFWKIDRQTDKWTSKRMNERKTDGWTNTHTDRLMNG